MLFKLKNLVIAVIFALFGWLGWSSYHYFFDTQKPELELYGIDNNECYKASVACTVSCDKPGAISIWLDKQPLINNFTMRSAHQERAFTVPTKTIANGTHTLKALFVDTTYHKNKTELQRSFIVDNIPLQAALVRADENYKVFQGRTLHIQFQANKELKRATVSALSAAYPCFPESKNSFIYEAFIPIACEEKPSEYLFSIDIADKVGNTLVLDNKFQIVPYPFKKQILNISENKIKQEREQAECNNFERDLESVLEKSPKEKLWRGSFCAPIDIQRITCDFGTVRTTQHKGRYAHKALDVINTPKSVVWAPQDGIVALKQRYEMGGNTVVIDHGWGVVSLFFHLDSFANISVGSKVAKGNPIGTIGKTGYATGYHLHWEMRINSVAVDPIQWTKETF